MYSVAWLTEPNYVMYTKRTLSDIYIHVVNFTCPFLAAGIQQTNSERWYSDV